MPFLACVKGIPVTKFNIKTAPFPQSLALPLQPFTHTVTLHVRLFRSRGISSGGIRRGFFAAVFFRQAVFPAILSGSLHRYSEFQIKSN